MPSLLLVKNTISTHMIGLPYQNRTFFCSTVFMSSKVQWCGLRPLVLRQDRSESQKSVLVFLQLHAVVLVLVLQVCCYVVKYGIVTLVVIMILKDTETFQVLFMVSPFCVWNITIVEINSGVHLLKREIRQVPLLPVVLVLRISWCCWSNITVNVLLF